ncbi:MAG: hypothetical protein A3F63_15910 [Pseudomonadales bacterium RIFCSPHIGHO2_12_FULL_40_16]|uniref:hypothetical protein n=1 Tax=Acinetobacter johnsonii TaxID=40214 RepID=UPI0008AB1F5A|nr:hypothetical protein [Acinetobacter johnsonii]MCF7643216.1 hypothetical protein [Acinetobacter johnsonii]OHC20254.1 MAG: hypothetical protein A3F63_15910 [Pseudomonadales bacterium RIFCSPHIGHO2_12_FULL_40_16]
MNKKISTVRRGTIIFLSLLTILVIALLIYGYGSMHDPEKGMFSGGEEVSEVWIDETKTFNSDLGLYEIEVKSDDGVGKKVYWQERKGKGVSLTIKCLYFKTGATSCEFNTHQPNYGFNTSYIKIDFHSELLPHWQEIYQDAEQLIHSFNTGEKQNEAY